LSIELRGIAKSFGQVTVVRGVDLRIATGELCVLLGPSGSGKSTLLRIIAGLEEPDDGRVLLHGEDVTRADPRRRGIGFVFQHYALFRHLTVAENVEFPLRVQKVPRAQRRARREELLELVGLAGYGGRRPGQLSGGQQQRVALARALAAAPRVLLLDEPFGALDARIRVELRHAIRSIHRELGITTVFVTHDQEEAFALADRLAVLADGRLLEVGAPPDLYLHPRQERVATFLGDANVLVGEASERGVRLGEVELPLGVTAEKAPGGRVRVVFRPEDVQLGAASPGAAQLGLARVEEATFAGSFERLRLRLPTPPGVRGVAPPAPFGSAFVWLDAIRPQPEARRLPLQSGDEVPVAVRRVHVLASAALRLLVLGRGTGEGEEPGPAARFAAALAERTATTISKAGATPPPDGWDLALFDLPEEGAAPPRPGFGAHLRMPGPEVDHLLFVDPGAALPRRILVCIAVGEPGKEDVSFAERLAWRLAAQVTVLTVLPGSAQEPPPHVRRFLDAAARALGRRGVEVTTRVRHGTPRREILAEIAEGQHDLLVTGAPVPPRGQPFGLLGLVERLLADKPCPILVVRSLHPAAVPAERVEMTRSAR
jgi:sulfate transport system ATP-binding protein